MQPQLGALVTSAIQAAATEDMFWMGQALLQAERALATGEVPVGCVFVTNNVAVASGHNLTMQARNASLHAEMVAMDQLLGSADGRQLLSACSLYVTLEPCVMCAAALRLAGVRRAVYGGANPRFGGCGSVLAAHTAGGPAAPPALQCASGVRAPEAIALLQRFYAQGNDRAPVPARPVAVPGAQAAAGGKRVEC